MDALSDVLDSLKLKAVVYQKVPLTDASWGIAIPQDAYSQFWRLLKGSCYITVAGGPVLKMNEGEFILVPHGAAHSIMGQPGNALVPSPQYVKALQSGHPMFQGHDEETLLIGGHFEFTSTVPHPFVASLPGIIRINSTQTELRLWLQQAGTFMADELSAPRAGSSSILSRLAEIVFLLIIRAYIEEAEVPQGFLQAFKDPRISASLNAMHAAPGKEWDLHQLASSAGMSRSLYCKEFKRLLGQTPLAYLTDWRILKAQGLLINSKENISEIAEKVGYHSEAAFNRLFKTKTGETPASYRRKALANSHEN